MTVAELKAITRERGLRGYSRLRKAELIALLQNNPPLPHLQLRTRDPQGPLDLILPHLQVSEPLWGLHCKPEGLLNRRAGRSQWKHNQLGLDQIGQDSQNR